MSNVIVLSIIKLSVIMVSIFSLSLILLCCYMFLENGYLNPVRMQDVDAELLLDRQGDSLLVTEVVLIR
jgi:hypothetical protein